MAKVPAVVPPLSGADQRRYLLEPSLEVRGDRRWQLARLWSGMFPSIVRSSALEDAVKRRPGIFPLCDELPDDLAESIEALPVLVRRLETGRASDLVRTAAVNNPEAEP